MKARPSPVAGGAQKSVRDFGLRAVAAVGEFVVPLSFGVLVLDAVGGAGNLLLGRGDFGGAQRLLMRGESLRLRVVSCIPRGSPR